MHQFSSDGLISSTFDLESIRVGSLERASLTNGQGECSTKSKSSIGTDAVRHSCSKSGNRFRQWATAGRPLVQVNWQRRAPRHLLYANSEIVRRKSNNARPFTDVPYPPHDALCVGGLPAWAIQVARGLDRSTNERLTGRFVLTWSSWSSSWHKVNARSTQA